jgi:hypothetical protein
MPPPTRKPQRPKQSKKQNSKKRLFRSRPGYRDTRIRDAGKLRNEAYTWYAAVAKTLWKYPRTERGNAPGARSKPARPKLNRQNRLPGRSPKGKTGLPGRNLKSEARWSC